MNTEVCEVWKSILGFDGYQVSNFGRIRSLNRFDAMGRSRKGMVLQQCRNGNKGYTGVQIHGKNIKTHRAVCIAFLGERGSDYQVNHKNGARADNRLENLEWCTGQQNVIHAYRELGKISTGGHSGKTGDKHHASKKVVGTRLSDGFKQVFGSTAEAARVLGIGSGSIPRVCSGKYKHSAGWGFQYLVEQGMLK